MVAVTGDGFYMYSVANAAIAVGGALSGAVHVGHLPEPQLQHRHARRPRSSIPTAIRCSGGLEAGYFDPPIDFAKEAEAAGAYGENVKDPAQVGPALARGLEQIRSGDPAVISVWLPKILRDE